MFVNKIETIRIPEHPNLLWVKVYTNEGLFGLGETWFGAEAVEADIHSRIAPLLLGQNPTEIEYIYSKMRPYIGFFGTGVEMRALSALDVALWDLNGKINIVPLYDLLGGKTKSNIRVYNTCAGPYYVSQNADVRPENFGTNKIKNKNIQLYEDLEMFNQLFKKLDENDKSPNIRDIFQLLDDNPYLPKINNEVPLAYRDNQKLISFLNEKTRFKKKY